jgi:hypothetical protein
LSLRRDEWQGPWYHGLILSLPTLPMAHRSSRAAPLQHPLSAWPLSPCHMRTNCYS